MALTIDLMYGLPGQTHASFRRDLATLAEHGVPSRTLYDLRVNERTPIDGNLKGGSSWSWKNSSRGGRSL